LLKKEYVFVIGDSVYNRPDEVADFLESLSKQDYSGEFEVVIVEDGSANTCESVVLQYRNQLDISYYFKENSGPVIREILGCKKQKAIISLFLIRTVSFRANTSPLSLFNSSTIM
jgi:hypothetical protein